MPTSYRPRPARCSHCGDLVLIAERTVGTLFGAKVGVKPRIELEHADPSPDGELYDPVDDACRREPVRPTA